jgi:hypothetical protein
MIVELNKRQTYFAILIFWVFLCLVYQSIWIFSRTATAEIYGVSKSNFGRPHSTLREVTWLEASYRVGEKIYYDSYLKDGYDLQNYQFKVRYLIFCPSLSRADTFVSNWGPLILFFVLMGIVTSIVFIRKDIFSDQVVIQLHTRRPFIKIENNQIEDYDVHDIEKEKLNETQQTLKEKLQAEERSSQKSDISTSVYKFNPNAIAIFAGYVILFFWCFYSLLSGSMGYTGIIFFGSVLVFIPLYVQNTNNPVFKAKIPDEGSLLFSLGGVQFKEEFYPLENIEAAVVYLESFRGFTYRERVTTGKVKTKSSGDNNKISFRYNQEVMDFIFILDESSDYWSFKNLMSSWSAKGVNVLLQKVFEDDFVIQEMVHFKAG